MCRYLTHFKLNVKYQSKKNHPEQTKGLMGIFQTKTGLIFGFNCSSDSPVSRSVFALIVVCPSRANYLIS